MRPPPPIDAGRCRHLFRLFVCATALGAALLLAACAPLPQRALPAAGEAPPAFPSAFYAAAAMHGDEVFAVDPAQSLVTVIVHRGGRLAQLGHDHVVASRDVRGFVDVGTGRADLYVRLDRMSVDEPALRREAHFDTQPSATDIAGTRTNMLERVLHVEKHPFVEVAVRRVAPPPATDTPAATSAATGLWVSMVLNGMSREVPVKLTMNEHGDDFEVSGSFSIDQTDFGLVPMSLFGGTITIENRLDLHFDVRGQREAAPIAAIAHRRSD